MSASSTQIMLMTPPIVDAAEFAPALKAALDAAPVAAVVICFGALDPHTLLKSAKELVNIVQNAGVAALLYGEADIVGKSGADGVHMSGTAELSGIMERFHPAKIVGAGSLRLKDDAMTAGEYGVDYVMFGEPQSHPLPVAFDSIAERVGWWAQIFEVPCVGYAPSLPDVEELVNRNADFVLLGAAVWEHPEGVMDAMKKALSALPASKATRS
jgi:thiamine-phosphate pyrophosphorylase